jgi:hypothetical protein
MMAGVCHMEGQEPFEGEPQPGWVGMPTTTDASPADGKNRAGIYHQPTTTTQPSGRAGHRAEREPPTKGIAREDGDAAEPGGGSALVLSYYYMMYLCTHPRRDYPSLLGYNIFFFHQKTEPSEPNDEPELRKCNLDKLFPVLERHPRLFNAIHPFPAPLMPGNGWDGFN